MKYHIRVRACALILEGDSILLIEFNDGSGLHYNLPAGGVEPGESIVEAVIREAKEEASIDVDVGPLAFVYEDAPHLNANYNGTSPHGLQLMFDCKIKQGSVPALPIHPDPNQTDVKWIPLNELDQIILYPNIKSYIIDYSKSRSKNLELIEEHKLEVYN
jgi:8-oxo-dGTP diphosphatase